MALHTASRDRAILASARPHHLRAVEASVLAEIHADSAGKPWYLADEVLDVLLLARRNPPAIVRHTKTYAMTTDEWCAFEGPVVSSLKAWKNTLAPYQSVFACDLIAAVTGLRLVGVHFTYHEERFAELAAEIDAALAARVERAA